MKRMLDPFAATALAGSVMVLSFFIPLGCSCQTASTDRTTVPAASSVSTRVAAEPTGAPQDVTHNGDSARLCTYRDRRNRFTIRYPAAWEETDLRLLGDTEVFGAEVVGFADHDGPTTPERCYTDMLQVNILDDRPYTQSVLDQIRDILPKTLERLRKRYDSVAVVRSWEETEIAGTRAMTFMLRASKDGQSILGLDCVLVANDRLYEIEFATLEEDWSGYEALFNEILDDFETSVSWD